MHIVRMHLYELTAKFWNTPPIIVYFKNTATTFFYWYKVTPVPSWDIVLIQYTQNQNHMSYCIETYRSKFTPFAVKGRTFHYGTRLRTSIQF